MTAALFDLGQRLRAADTGHVVDRLRHCPVPTLTDPVAVRAHTRRGVTTVSAATHPGGPVHTAHGPDALAALDELAVGMGTETHPCLVTDDDTTLPTLLTLARATHADARLSGVAAAVAWCADRAAYPGGAAVVNVLDACRRRFVTGTDPDAERDASTWREWLGVTDTTVAGVLDTLAVLTADEPLPLLASLAEDDTYSWGRAQIEYDDGRDWPTPDNPGRAAIGLRGRCDAADLYAAAFLGDPLYRLRAVHTGHVVTGEAAAADTTRTLRVVCTRLDARLRTGNTIVGWAGSPHDHGAALFTATVADTAVVAGRLVLGVAKVRGAAPAAGQPVTLHPTPPSPFTQRAGRGSYRRLYRARRSWLTTGRTPVPSRRDVPLEVLIAGAEAD